MSDGKSNAFSLLELVLVLVVIGIALAIVTPSLGGWSRGMRLRSATDTLLAATRFARDRAVTDAAPQRLTVDAATGRVAVTADASFNPGVEEQPRTFDLPAGVTVTLQSTRGETLDAIDFHPDGRVDASVLQLTNDRGEVTTLACETPAKGFTLQPAGGVR